MGIKKNSLVCFKPDLAIDFPSDCDVGSWETWDSVLAICHQEHVGLEKKIEQGKDKFQYT